MSINSQDSKVSGELITSVPMTVTFDPAVKDEEVSYVAFSYNSAMVLRNDSNRTIDFYQCEPHQDSDMDFNNLICDQLVASFNNANIYDEYKNFKTFEGVMTTWNCDSQGCFVLVVDIKAKTVQKFDLEGDIHSVFVTDNQAQDHLVVAATDGAKVTIMASDAIEGISSLDKVIDITPSNSEFTPFCPISVQGAVIEDHVLHVLNSCKDHDFQAALEYDISTVVKDKNFKFSGYTSFTRTFSDIFTCPTMGGYFAGSKNALLNGGISYIKNGDGLDTINVPPSILGPVGGNGYLFNTYEHTCLSNNYIVVHDKSGSDESDGKTVTTIISGDYGQEKRYVSQFTSDSFHFSDSATQFGITHWLPVPGKHLNFMTTLHVPRIRLFAEPGLTQDTTDKVNFVFQNGEGASGFEHTIVADISISKVPTTGTNTSAE